MDLLIAYERYQEYRRICETLEMEPILLGDPKNDWENHYNLLTASVEIGSTI